MRQLKGETHTSTVQCMVRISGGRMQRGGLPVVVLMVPDEGEHARPFVYVCRLIYMCVQGSLFLLRGFFFSCPFTRLEMH